jgi:phosphatidylglycerophosphate synthase
MPSVTDADRLSTWAFSHALLQLAAGAAGLAFGTTWPVLVAGAASFGVFIRQSRGRWTPDERFGAGNAVTALRLGATLLAAGVVDRLGPTLATALIFSAAFALDGLDGALARRRGQASAFGEYFDKESDAFLVWLLGFGLVRHEAFGAWVLLLGALRYVFVVALRVMPAGVTSEYRSAWARYIYAGCVVALLLAHVPAIPTRLAAAAVAIGGGALTFSFLHYFAWLDSLRPRSTGSPTRAGLFAFLFLNALLLLPAYLGAASTADFFPIPDTTSPTATNRWNRGWYDVALYLFVRRPNQDLFRLSADVAILLVLLAWCRTPGGRSRAGRIGMAAYLLLLAYEGYEAIVTTFFHRAGLFYEDVRYVINFYYLAVDAFGHGLAGQVFFGTVGLAASIWAVRRAFGALERAIADASWQRVLRSASVPLLALIVGSWLWYGPIADTPVVRSTAPRPLLNAATSAEYAVKLRAVRTAAVDSSYFAFSSRPIRQRPTVYLILIESYGRLLDDAPELRTGYRALVDSVARRLAAGGWYSATSTSVAPVTGGLSWLSMSTVLSGMSIGDRTSYLRFRERVDRLPHLVRYMNEGGWHTVAIQPPNRSRPGLPADNPLGFRSTVYFDDLAYTGRPYGLWIIPDQYSLQHTHHRLLERWDGPFFVFFETASTHAPWDDLPSVVADWRMLGHQAPLQEPAGPTMSSNLAGSIFNHLHLARRDTPNRYLASIAYDFEVLTRYLLESAPGGSLVLILGDHQPPMLPSTSFETPVHVIARDSLWIARFEAYGFRPGMRIPRREEPIAHSAVFSMLVDVLTAEDGGPLPSPFFRREGVPSSILWQP